jgi:6,7-dimethyl-8-ribityllumazine synthase
MPNHIRGNASGQGLRIGIVVSRWNKEITDGLLQGVLRALIASEVNESDITVVETPGAFEIPFALSLLAGDKKKYDALIALGCLIKGETAHFEYIADAAMRGILSVSETYTIPVSYGVLTTYNESKLSPVAQLMKIIKAVKLHLLQSKWQILPNN